MKIDKQSAQDPYLQNKVNSNNNASNVSLNRIEQNKQEANNKEVKATKSYSGIDKTTYTPSNQNPDSIIYSKPMAKNNTNDVKNRDKSETTIIEEKKLKQKNDPAIKKLEEKNNPAIKKLEEKNDPAIKKLEEKTDPAIKKLEEKTDPAIKKLKEKTDPILKKIDENTDPEKKAQKIKNELNQIGLSQEQQFGDIAGHIKKVDSKNSTNLAESYKVGQYEKTIVGNIENKRAIEAHIKAYKIEREATGSVVNLKA